jgi:hypothetical protein
MFIIKSACGTLRLFLRELLTFAAYFILAACWRMQHRKKGRCCFVEATKSPHFLFASQHARTEGCACMVGGAPCWRRARRRRPYSKRVDWRPRRSCDHETPERGRLQLQQDATCIMFFRRAATSMNAQSNYYIITLLQDAEFEAE